MGFFNDLGKKAERLRQQARDAEEEEATHTCRNCDALLYADREECPECGSDAVVEIEE